MIVRIENYYSDGHRSKRDVTLDEPTIDGQEALDDWFSEVVYQHTGDGHGADNDLGSCYVATVITAADPGLVGKSCEWTD